MVVEENKLITKELVNNFIQVSGDNNPIHWDKEYCKSTSFKKPIAHGLLLASFFSNLIATEYPGKGSIYLSQSLSFQKPCFIGDEILVKIQLQKKENSKYFLYTTISNANNEILVEGEALVLKK